MDHKKAVRGVTLMMAIWFLSHLFFVFVANRWAMLSTIVCCTLPMLIVKHNTFGATFCNTVKYKTKEYVPYFLVTILGTALLSALTFLLFEQRAVAEPKGASYAIVFSCLFPAFFEEWLVRGGVFSFLSPYGKKGIVICAVIFALMHTEPQRMVYAFFAGLMITVLVYLTECIYIGMLLHFLNNYYSFLLSGVPEKWQYIALGIIAVLFFISGAFMSKTKLFEDMKKLR